MKSRNSGRILLATGAVMLAASAAASAQSTPFGSYRDATLPPLTCEEGTFVGGMTDKLVPWNQRYTSNVTVPAGVLSVDAYWSWDAYDNRVNVTQPNEKWRVNVAGATSEWSDDVEDMTTAGLTVGNLEPFATPGGTIVFEHWSVDGDTSSPNSVQPLGLCVTVQVPTQTTPAPTVPPTATPTVPPTPESTLAPTVPPTVPPTPAPTIPPVDSTLPTTVPPTTPPTPTPTSTVPSTVVPVSTVPVSILVHVQATNPDPTPTGALTVPASPQAASTTQPVVTSAVPTTPSLVSSTMPTPSSVVTVPATPAPVLDDPDMPLAFTGAQSTPLTVAALSFLLVGAGMLVATRKQTS